MLRFYRFGCGRSCTVFTDLIHPLASGPRSCLNEPMLVFVLPPVPPVSPPVITRVFAPATEAWLPAHRGVDLLARSGQRVSAPRNGRVVLAKRIADRPVVVVESGSVRFTFEPVRSAVPAGTRVRTGQTIGRIGRGGHCDRRCLHWGAKVDGEYVDPMSFLPRRRPILKPIAGRIPALATAYHRSGLA